MRSGTKVMPLRFFIILQKAAVLFFGTAIISVTFSSGRKFPDLQRFAFSNPSS